jgi:DNA-binding PadR family transcriptional regulator
MADLPEITPTGRVILGMIALGRQTGYDIKQFVDQSTRHFWAASYGQIYPELKRLEQQGLVRSRSEPTGGRLRSVYELTDTGRTALLDWLGSDAEPTYEVRDEGMLKLFFSDFASPAQRRQNLRAMRDRHARKLAQLRALEAKVGPHMRKGPELTLAMGIALTEATIACCEATEQRLALADQEEQ